MKTLSMIALAGLALGLGACSRALGPMGRTLPPGDVLYYPEPPQEPRVQFLATLSDIGDLKGWESGGPGIGKPYGLSIHKGSLYVCDTVLRGVQVFDLVRQELSQIRPRGEGRLPRPINCTVDTATGHLYVTDSDRRQIVEFDSTHSYVAAFGEEGGTPADVFVDGDTLWVADLATRSVRVYDKASRRFVRSIEGDREDPASTSAIRQPTNIWVSGNEVYVSDFGDFQVKVFDRAGAFVRLVGGYGPGLGQFVRPKGIAVDRDQRLYVVDTGFENVQIFDRNGALLLFFGGPYTGLGDMYLPAAVDISYDPSDVEYFQAYAAPGQTIEYVILVSNQFGPDKINVYGFLAKPDTIPAGS
ncbi:MAG: 6-bladed beta-propeller [Gemmatimonadota bacterium]|nr:6-bladed beta-propeller [Gemmatimonadota bacterium]MDH5758044.1 6-bladed beta-propeller [Gemmatimonadota bacterium]